MLKLNGVLEILSKHIFINFNYSQKVQDSVSRASIRVDSNTENIAGVHLPCFFARETEDSGDNFLFQNQILIKLDLIEEVNLLKDVKRNLKN